MASEINRTAVSPPAGGEHTESMGLGRLSDLGPEAAMQIRQLTEKMPGGFFIYHARGGEELLYANAALLRLFGCETAEEFRSLTGNSFRGMVHPDDLEDVEKSIWEQIGGNSYDLDYVEYRIIRRDGSVRWVEDYGHFTHNDRVGDIFYVFLADATDKHLHRQAVLGRKEQELEALANEQSRSLEIIRGLSVDYESIFSLDLDADVLQPYRLSRRVAEQLKGLTVPYRFQEFAQQYVEACISPEDRELMERVLTIKHLRERLSRQSTYHVTYRILGPAGPEYLQLRCVNVDGGAQASRIMLGVRMVDSEIVLQLDQRRLLEDALHRAHAAEIARSTFLSNMSHDIRTPMNAVMGFAALARTHANDPEQVMHDMDRIQESGEQLLHLLSAVLELSHLESGQVSIEEAPCRLAELVEHVRDTLRPQAERKQLQFVTDLSGMTHGEVCGDRGRLTQVLLCLADNAVKYTPPGGRVVLSLRQEFREMRDYCVCRFAVEDTGIGMSPEFMQHLYEPFEREQNTTLCGVQGSGLGLAIARGLAEMMGGSLDAASEPGRGSTFTLTLSMRFFRPDPRQCPPADGPSPGAFAGMRLLLVEDNQINVMIESELLEEAGFVVDVAMNGREAVDTVKRSAPGYYRLVLMDIQMPVMDGREAARAIRALEDPALAAVPIIALSANAFDQDVRQSLACGMEAHLPKPLHIPQLLEQITRIMEEKRG